MAFQESRRLVPVLGVAFAKLLLRHGDCFGKDARNVQPRQFGGIELAYPICREH